MTGGVAAVVLAAGRARRFAAGDDDSKVVATFDGVPLVRHVVTRALASRSAPVLVVTGYAASAVEAALAGLPVEILHNPDYAAGMAGSLKAGLAGLPLSVDGALILLADMPLVASDTFDRLIAMFERDPDAVEAVIPTFEGRQGNPVLIGRALFAALEGLSGDEGARKLLASAGRALAFCAVEDRGIEIDVDTRAALAALHGDG